MYNVVSIIGNIYINNKYFQLHLFDFRLIFNEI